MTARALLLFTKPARPGRVKTRLIGALSAADAACLHAAFQSDLIERFGGGPVELRVFWALEPGEALPEWPRGGRRQEGDDLGERLARAVAASADADAVAIVGSDHPDLPLERVVEAFAALDDGADVVFGPAADGGYYLVALRPAELPPGIFDRIPWSTERVLERSLARCVDLGLEVRLLAIGHDVDRPDDLGGLAERLARQPGLAPRTLRELERILPSTAEERAP